MTVKVNFNARKAKKNCIYKFRVLYDKPPKDFQTRH